MKRKKIIPIAIRKKKRTCVKILQQQQLFSSTKTIPESESEFNNNPQNSEPEFYLPDDCWEHVFAFLINPVDINPVDGNNEHNFKSLSRVSKHFLTITNRLIFSMTIYHPQLCYLPRFFHRFSNLNSLSLLFDLFHDLDLGIALALRNRPTLKYLSIFGIQLKDTNYVTSYCIDSFLSLKGLNSLKFQCSRISDDLLYSIARESLPLKSFFLESCTGYSYRGIYGLLSKCSGIKHLGIQDDDFLNNHHVFKLSLLLPDLVSINLSQCYELRESALFALIKNCRSLVEITMRQIYFAKENIYIEEESVENFDVNPHLKFLHFAHTSFLNDRTIILFASVFPNLQLLDLSFCDGISKKGICQVLSKCCKLRHLDLTSCNDVRGLKMNFVVRQLEVLDLCDTNVDDKTLYEISKICCGLLKLVLFNCKYVTKKGMKRVVENFTQCHVMK
ncbi:uncharacterized protein LOC131649755 [Vicia villosa]|uniref:uncharacterized protein LOC131649755 n=1 Tax=Vicia villosa TaxID=3911 RepID=UPI00273CE590|nr:uncharacterized protein LOC131649755 [Vicia villosa]